MRTIFCALSLVLSCLAFTQDGVDFIHFKSLYSTFRTTHSVYEGEGTQEGCFIDERATEQESVAFALEFLRDVNKSPSVLQLFPLPDLSNIFNYIGVVKQINPDVTDAFEAAVPASSSEMLTYLHHRVTGQNTTLFDFAAMVSVPKESFLKFAWRESNLIYLAMLYRNFSISGRREFGRLVRQSAFRLQLATKLFLRDAGAAEFIGSLLKDERRKCWWTDFSESGRFAHSGYYLKRILRYEQAVAAAPDAAESQDYIAISERLLDLLARTSNFDTFLEMAEFPLSGARSMRLVFMKAVE